MQDGKYGVIDIKGKTIIDFQYNSWDARVNKETVWAGYKGYDIVFLYDDYNEAYRLEHTN